MTWRPSIRPTLHLSIQPFIRSPNPNPHPRSSSLSSSPPPPPPRSPCPRPKHPSLCHPNPAAGLPHPRRRRPPHRPQHRPSSLPPPLLSESPPREQISRANSPPLPAPPRAQSRRRCPDPGCKDSTLQPEACRDVVPTPLFQRWGAALCDMALEGLKFYCPFNDCSTLLVDNHQDGDAVIRDVECPHCSRMFCAQFKVPWHDGVDCTEFQRLGKDERGREDLLLRKVAQESKWRRCAKCKMYVERVEGCVYIVCRCGHHFCHLCGSAMAKGNHRCSKCKRTW
ncbi:E3 ubiquitin-protein ligase RSL1-like [Triticum urartu]|nr:E3 ubiquitin-protein ligase RSL1-like [Triticum urartu]